MNDKETVVGVHVSGVVWK